jgi:Mce-associated membrane protein
MTVTLEKPTEIVPEKRKRPWAFVLIVLVIVATIGVGGWLQVKASEINHSEAATNKAVRDSSGSQVATQLATSVAGIFSYSATDPAATARLAEKVLTGSAAAQYTLLFRQVTAHAGEQHLTVTTTVVSTAVSSLTDDSAVVLFFCDQRAVRAGQPATVAAADLLVTADRTDGRWLISAIQAV